MKTTLLAPMLALPLLAALSCAPDKAACVPGETQRCLCPDQSDGAQRCEAEGASWSECVCEAGAEGDTDVDTDTDTDTDSGSGSGDDTGSGSTGSGAAVYATYCAACHGADGRGGSGPDLRREVPELSDAELRRVITEGEDEMPGFDLPADDLEALVAWLRDTFGRGGSGDEEEDD